MTVELSPERVGRITGSRIAPILGERRSGKSRVGVLREMVREHFGAEQDPRDPYMDEMAAYGHEHEADAITLYERETGLLVYGCQEFVIHPVYDFLGVTVDGLVGDDGTAEIKCPSRATFTHIDEREDYKLQTRLQIECTQRLWCDFCVWRTRQPIEISRVEWDPTWLPSVLPVLEAFMAEYEAVVASEELSAPFLAPKVKRTRKAAAA